MVGKSNKISRSNDPITQPLAEKRKLFVAKSGVLQAKPGMET